MSGAGAPVAAELFRARYGARPAGVWSAPGRVNLIGEHTDYSGGLVLPFAIDFRARVALGPAAAAEFRVSSAQRPRKILAAPPGDLRPGSAAAIGWQAYPFGVLWALRQAGHEIPPLDLAVDSAVPAGAGLSSSAAMECAVALAVSEHLGLGLSRPELARLAQRAENDFVGVPCGLMDQMASTCCIAGHALFFDVGRDEIEHIPFDPVPAGLRMLAIDTRAHHALADGEYARRRAECETATRQLGLASLAQITVTGLDAALRALDGDVLRRRVRHVVTENERVRRVVRLLRDGDIGAIGPELSASHASLRDDFEVSCAELDLAAEAAERAGALGARMVGGGFGGSVIALSPAGEVAAVGRSVRESFALRGCAPPRIREVSPAGGAHRDA